MKKRYITIIIGIGALVIGGFAGASLFRGENTNSIKGEPNSQNALNEVDYNIPDPVDYVSVRPDIDKLPIDDISQTEKEGLLFMREEEKLARDVYTTLYEKWGLTIFSNIAQSEQTHTEAVRNLLVKYNLEDPVTDDSIGVFTNETIQKLYDDLTAQGMISLEEALVVGAIIEDLDISDLDVQVGLTDNEDIKLVYENLLRGSRNHLHSFISQLESRGGSYDPQYISITAYNKIINSPRETGGKGGEGKSSDGGRGWGNGR